MEKYPKRWRDLDFPDDAMISLAMRSDRLEIFKWFELNYKDKINAHQIIYFYDNVPRSQKIVDYLKVKIKV